MKTTLLALALTILLVGCARTRPASPAPSSVPEAEISSSVSSESEISAPAPAEVQPPVSPEVERYLDYFLAHGYVNFLVDDIERAGFADEQMAAFALSHLIAESHRPGATEYDPAVGFPKADMDAAAIKYFGAAPKNYENRKTTLLPSGNVGSTGWGGSASLYLLHGLETTEDGRTRGRFYRVGFSMDEDRVAARERLLKGDFSAYPEVDLVTMVFTEEQDDEGPFLRFYSAVWEPAQPPYTLYAG